MSSIGLYGKADVMKQYKFYLLSFNELMNVFSFHFVLTRNRINTFCKKKPAKIHITINNFQDICIKQTLKTNNIFR